MIEGRIRCKYPPKMTALEYAYYLFSSFPEIVPEREMRFLQKKLEDCGEGFTANNQYTMYFQAPEKSRVCIHRLADRRGKINSPELQERCNIAVKHIPKIEAAIMSGDQGAVTFLLREVVRDLEGVSCS